MSNIAKVDVLHHKGTYIVRIDDVNSNEDDYNAVRVGEKSYLIRYQDIVDSEEARSKPCPGSIWQHRTALVQSSVVFVNLAEALDTLKHFPDIEKPSGYRIVGNIYPIIPALWIGTIVDIIVDRKVIVVQWSAEGYSGYPLDTIEGLEVGTRITHSADNMFRIAQPLKDPSSSSPPILVQFGDWVWLAETCHGHSLLRFPTEVIAQFNTIPTPSGALIVQFDDLQTAQSFVDERVVVGNERVMRFSVRSIRTGITPITVDTVLRGILHGLVI